MNFVKQLSALGLATAIAISTSVASFAADHKVQIKSFKFSPAKISVAVGDTITFTNMDGAPHTGTALNGSFDTGRLNKGDAKSIKINAAGKIAFKCSFHPAMKGTVSAK